MKLKDVAIEPSIIGRCIYMPESVKYEIKGILKGEDATYLFLKYGGDEFAINYEEIKEFYISQDKD